MVYAVIDKLTTSPNCRTSALSVGWQMDASRAPGADLGLRRTATIDMVQRIPLHVRQFGETTGRVCL
jgi:hypothetical protein